MKITRPACHRIIPFIFLIIAQILISASVSFAEENETVFVPLDRDEVFKDIREVKSCNYPNADLVKVAQKQWVMYQKDGTYVEWYEFYAKVITEKGKRRLKTVSSYFTIPYNTTKFTLCEVIRKGGSVVPVDIEKNSSVMIEHGQMDSNIYNPDSKVLQVTIPEIFPGDTVHCISFDDFSKVRMPGTWSDYVGFEDVNPIKYYEYIVIAPKEKPLASIAIKSEIPGTVKHEKYIKDDLIVYKWTARDIPRLFIEPEMPPLYGQIQRLLVSTLKNWEEVSRWYWSLCRPNIEKTTPEMKEKVLELINGIDDPAEKIGSVFYWVSQEIRYLGLTLEKNSPGYEPHPVDMTFQRRAGVCRDKAALLVSMLRLAHFDAYPALIMNGPKKDPEVPQPWFNHAVVCVINKDGSHTLMDPTDENTKELFPAYLNNQSYIIATPEGETLRTSPIETAEKNMMRIWTDAGLNNDGEMRAECVLFFEGINDNAYRGYFSRCSPEEQRAYFEKLGQKFFTGARLVSYSLQPENMLDTSQQLKAHLVYETGDIRIAGNDAVMLPIPSIGENVGVIHHLINKIGLNKRKYPLFTKFACGIAETINLDLKQSVGNPLSLPEFETVNNEGTEWSRKLTCKDNILKAENVFKMKLPEYSPDQYTALKNTLGTIESNNRKMPVFEVSSLTQQSDEKEWYRQFDPDVVVLNEDVEIDLTESTEWAETRHMKMKVITYAGIKKTSDIRISYNPFWESVDVLKAVVTSENGVIQEVNTDEINIMDAEWAGDAPRYPPSRVLVVNLPGVRTGSTIEYTIMRVKKNRPFFSIGIPFFYQEMLSREESGTGGMPFFSINSVFRYFDPVEQKTIRLKVPKNIQLKMIKSDSGLGLEHEWRSKEKQIIKDSFYYDAGKKVYEYTASRVKPVKYESGLPPWYSFNPVLFAASGTWSQYAIQAREAFQGAVSSQFSAEREAKRLVKDIISQKARIVAIRDFVARNIKYIDIPFNEFPLDLITSADRVLSDGYGNSADRAVLLYTMLSAVGFKPEFILSSWVSPVKDLQLPFELYPSPEWFDKVLVGVNIEEGYVYLNDTDQYAELGSTMSDFRPGLFLKSGEIMTINAADSELRDKKEVAIEIRLNADGKADIRKKTTFYGNDYALFRRKLSEMRPEERRRHHLEMVSSISLSARPGSEYITDYDVYPGIEEFSVLSPDYAIRQGNFLYFKIPGLIKGIEGVNTGERENPLYREKFNRNSVRIVVELPEEMKSIEISPPRELLFLIDRSGKIEMHTDKIFKDQYSEVQSLRRQLSVQQNLDLSPVVVMQDEYPNLFEINRVLGQARTRTLLLEMKDQCITPAIKNINRHAGLDPAS
ncbi:MAG TPA: DUF3857 domain-containing protein, partial [Desulfobacteraceae bacterium]|nr:DUF3857 domain-containing protein [Desulfobacteraceae bacterium]HPJ69039.1 DUF3857 domain-containing protein [Desulfobacteraceae bacterium]